MSAGVGFVVSGVVIIVSAGMVWVVSTVGKGAFPTLCLLHAINRTRHRNGVSSPLIKVRGLSMLSFFKIYEIFVLNVLWVHKVQTLLLYPFF